MSKKSLDYEKLCCNYYSSWEDGCCMESCEYYNHNECPITYVKELLAEKDQKIATLEQQLATMKKALELALKDAYYDALEYYIGNNRPTQEEFVKQHIKIYTKQAQKELKNETI